MAVTRLCFFISIFGHLQGGKKGGQVWSTDTGTKMLRELEKTCPPGHFSSCSLRFKARKDAPGPFIFRRILCYDSDGGGINPCDPGLWCNFPALDVFTQDLFIPRVFHAACTRLPLKTCWRPGNHYFYTPYVGISASPILLSKNALGCSSKKLLSAATFPSCTSSEKIGQLDPNNNG